MPCPGPFHFSHIADYIYDFCPLPDPDVGLYILVRDVEHTSLPFVSVRPKHFLTVTGADDTSRHLDKSIVSQTLGSVLKESHYCTNKLTFFRLLKKL